MAVLKEGDLTFEPFSFDAGERGETDVDIRVTHNGLCHTDWRVDRVRVWLCNAGQRTPSLAVGFVLEPVSQVCAGTWL